MHSTNQLTRFGFNPSSEAQRLNRLPHDEKFAYYRQQLESYVNHLAQDEAVSILYRYYVDDGGEVFTSRSRNKETNVRYQIDFRERNGLFYQGILSAANLAKQNPHNLVVLYSPTGKKLFDDTGIESIDPSMLEFLQKPYADGQLYFMYFDGEKINNVAVSINKDNNPWLSEISGQLDDNNQIADEELRIFSYLTTPILLDEPDDFFQKNWGGNYLIYTNKGDKQYLLADVLSEMRKTLAGKKRLPINVYDATIASLANYEMTVAMVKQGYNLVLRQYMEQNGLDSIQLGGGCGGGTIAKGELIPQNPLEMVSSFSSQYRYLKQGGKDIFSQNQEEADEYGSLKFECPDCKLINERPRHKLLPKCQHCGSTKVCAPTK